MSRITLHEEIIEILKESPNSALTFRQIAYEVNRRGRYRKIRGYPDVRWRQISARCRHPYYRRLFSIEGGLVRLR